MATITYKSFLMYSTDGTSYQKLIDIKDYPDGILPDPDQVEVTTLSNKMRLYTEGLQDPGSSGLSFTANYDLDDVKAIEALKDQELYFAVWFGGTDPVTAGGTAVPDGSLGKFGGKGTVTYGLVGAGINDVREMNVIISPKSDWARITDGE